MSKLWNERRLRYAGEIGSEEKKLDFGVSCGD